jgi:subtilisin-like proprotein convertase family protein
MKKFYLLALVGVLWFVPSSQATLLYQSGTITVNTAIPDGNPVGVTSTHTIDSTPTEGLTRDAIASISSVVVRLNVSGGYNGDLYAYLTSDAGFAILLNRVGLDSGNAFGYSDAGFQATFAEGGSDIHNYQSGLYTLSGGQLTGTWSPDGRAIDPFSSGGAFSGASRTATFGSFNGNAATGNWTLFIADLGGGEQATLQSWELEITGVPEPTNVALGIFGGVFVSVRIRRWWKAKQMAQAVY